MTPFVRRVHENAEEGSVVAILCRYPTCYREYKDALRKATVEELKTALRVLQEFSKINGPSRKLIMKVLKRKEQK